MSEPRKSTAYQSLNPGCHEDPFDIDGLGDNNIESTLVERHRNHSNDSCSTSPLATKLRDFFKWALTPLGALITIYGLNIIAWGGMLFLLMCNAAPSMCYPDCNSINSPRRVWIEIDSQILNALFCVTGFGLAPWRIRDLYHWCFWKFGRREETRQCSLDALSKVHKNWFHMDRMVSNIGLLPTHALTEELLQRSTLSTKTWKMTIVIWGNILNTVFQTCLASCMWGMNRLDRPSWTTGLFVGLACVAAGIPGIVMWLEKKKTAKAKEYPGALLVVPRTANGDLPRASNYENS